MTMVRIGLDPGDNLDATVFHAAHRQYAIGDRLQPVGLPPHHDHLQAKLASQVNM
jgi:hypothetical protein